MDVDELIFVRHLMVMFISGRMSAMESEPGECARSDRL